MPYKTAVSILYGTTHRSFPTNWRRLFTVGHDLCVVPPFPNKEIEVFSRRFSVCDGYVCINKTT